METLTWLGLDPSHRGLELLEVVGDRQVKLGSKRYMVL